MNYLTTLSSVALYVDIFLTICTLVYALGNSSALKCARNMDMQIYHAFNIIIFTCAVHILSLGELLLLSIPRQLSLWQFISNVGQNTVYVFIINCVRHDWLRCGQCCSLHGKILTKKEMPR